MIQDDKCDLIAAVSKFERNNNHLLKGPAPSDAERMNSNGFERGRLTGTGPSGTDPVSPWLPPDAGSVNPPRTPSEIPTSRSLGGQGSHAMISGSTMGAIFRSPGEPPQRMYPVAGAGQFSPSHTSAGASTGIAGGPYSPHYSVYGQPSPLASQYGAYYSQYPHVYSHSSPAMLPGGHYPEIQSYSAVLASMGSQVQQTSGQSRIPYVSGHLAQYAASSGHRSSLSSPGEEHLHPETKVSPKPETRETSLARETTLAESGRVAASSKEAKYSSFPSHLRQSSSSHLRELSPQHDGGAGSKDTVYKVPCGKEGSLKHRILTRPPDIHIEDSTLVESTRHSSQRAGEPSTKRTKTYVQSPLATTTTTAANRNPGSSSQQQQGANLAPSHLHYPPHFTKGSIIQLANGDLKRVEDLRTEDFVHSAEISSDLKIDSSTVVRIDENADRGTAVLSFRVGEHKVPVSCLTFNCYLFIGISDLTQDGRCSHHFGF